MIKLDILDSQILSELSQNGRQEQATLAANLKLSRERIKYRLGRLVRYGVVQNFVTLINPSTLGISLYKTYFRLNNNRKIVTKLITFLDRHPRTFWVAECAGQWDLILVVYARSPKEYSAILDQALAQFSACILDFSVYTLTDAWYFSRGYLCGTNINQIYVGGESTEVRVDDLDHGILRSLAHNARLTYTQLARINKTSIATARHRLERLDELGVIAYHRVELDLAKLGRWYYKAQMYFSEYDLKREEELRKFCVEEPDIIFLVKQIGNCRLELELECESFETYNLTIDRLRDRFGGYINHIDTILIRKQRIMGVPMDMKPLG